LSSLPSPAPGLVIRFAYLWHRQAIEHRQEAEKDRPCLILLHEDGKRTYVCPITHAPPLQPEAAIEIPARVKAHLGLDDAPSWVIVSECNSFDWPGFDLRRTADGDVAYGMIPPRLYDRIREAALRLIRSHSFSNISR
jgi:mRNA-degrading endonuclease toxin of MazEF toxin-antitoxin module